LRSKSDYFKKLLSNNNNNVEKKYRRYVLKFINIPAPLLEVILKQDELNLNEIEVWENLIKWGIAQEKILDENVSKWDQENFLILERILHRFIPLIRFYDISSENYFSKVVPYEKILPKELQEELLKFHTIPGYIPPTFNTLLPRYPNSINSVIINNGHIKIFESWINRKKENVNYKFDLLYRASRDGNTAAEFHNKCDDKGATIVIAKITNSDHILGGYNPLDWNGFGYKFTKDSFIFSFTNRMIFKTAKVGYYNYDQYNQDQDSIFCSQSYGPTFGSGHDLSFQYPKYPSVTNSISRNPCSYTKIDIPITNCKIYSYYRNYDSFYIEDYEVFQIIK
jgi:hypothetical protein